MTLASLLEAAGIRTALVIDDVYDEVPTAADLRPAAAQWAIFFDDITPEHRAMLDQNYPEGTDRADDELLTLDGFVETVWRQRALLGGLADQIFEDYERVQAADKRYVDLVEGSLGAAALEVKTCGRSFVDSAKEADLLIVDLYLGADQDSSTLSDSIARLAEVVEARIENPPLVVLMSRSESLVDKRDQFRDDARLLESGFRILRKLDLDEGGHLETQIERLAVNSTETRRLAAFLAALNEGISEANRRTLTLIRKLRLSDIGQVQQLLLEFDGQPTGSYLVDVFDRVFQHELEGQRPIIDAAIALNEFSVSEHPPPYVSGSPDLQELAHRMLTENTKRLDLPGSAESRVAFGDVLRLDLAQCDSPEAHAAAGLDNKSVLLVITPACDLQRGLAPRILLVAGSCEAVTPQSWSYRPDDRTAATRIDDELVWIRWNTKSILTMSWQQLDDALDDESLTVKVRLRESHALQLQQKVLSGLGRVGMVSPMPATFAVNIEACIPNAGGILTRLEVPSLSDEGICFVGRDDDAKPNLRLVVTEIGCDEIQTALSALELDDVHQATREVLTFLRDTGEARRILSRGLKLNGITDNTWVDISPTTPVDNSGDKKVGLVSWNREVPTEALTPKLLRKAGLVLRLSDKNGEGAIGLSEAAGLGLLSD